MTEAMTEAMITPAAADDLLLREDAGGIATLTLNAPKSINALSEAMLDALRTAYNDASHADVKERILLNLGHFEDEKSIPLMIEALDHKGIVRRAAARALAGTDAGGDIHLRQYPAAEDIPRRVGVGRHGHGTRGQIAVRFFVHAGLAGRFAMHALYLLLIAAGRATRAGLLVVVVGQPREIFRGRA